MLSWALALVRLWTALYTNGMPAELSAARRAEIASDLWEFEHAPVRPRGAPAALYVLLRLLRGVHDDLLWRAELMDLRSRRRRVGVWATAGIALVSALWLRASLTSVELPQLPRSPIDMQSWLMSPIPPPPPPPPPPPLGTIKPKPGVRHVFPPLPPPPPKR